MVAWWIMEILIIHQKLRTTDTLQSRLTQMGHTCYILDSAEILLTDPILYPCDIVMIEMDQLPSLSYALSKTLFKPYIIGVSDKPNPELIMLAAASNVSDILQAPYPEEEVSEALTKAKTTITHKR